MYVMGKQRQNITKLIPEINSITKYAVLEEEEEN